MGTSHGNFIKYPRTPHLFGSNGTSDDKRLGEKASMEFLRDASLIVEEKIDGTNVGIHFASTGKMVLQCRGHGITDGMHPQYDLFKQWTAAKQPSLEHMLVDRYILFGEWMYARHSIHYLHLPHYFFEFDIYDKHEQVFLSLETRMKILDGTGIHTVPILHRGMISTEELNKLVGDSAFNSQFDNPYTNTIDQRMEGVYLRTESNERVSGRAKWVRPEFVKKIKQSTHWQHQQLIPNELTDGVDIWA